MGLALPFGLAAALLAAPILALYVLKMRRREVVVGSILLWGDAVRDLQANAPWQRLRPNLLLLLQLAALAGLVVALAQPYVLRASSVHGDVVVLLDASAPMNATDTPGYANRFSAAKARVGRLIDDLGSNDLMSIVLMARSPRVVIAQSGDRAALHSVLNTLSPTFETLDAAPALSLASSLARGGHDGTLEVVTGAGTVLPEQGLTRNLDLNISRVGGTMRDLAIVAFAAGFDDAGTLNALARIANYGPRRASTDIELRVDGHLLDVRTRDIEPGGQIDLLWPALPAGATVLQAHLTIHDDLAADNTAWATPPHPTQRRVALVTSGNVFLETALSLDPTVRLVTMTPATYAGTATARAAGAADLTILDGYRVAHLPQSNLLLINPPAGSWNGFSSGTPSPVGGTPSIVQDSAGLLRYVQAGDLHVAVAHPITATAWLRPALVAGAQPLLLAGENGGQRLAVITFDLHDSDLPLQPDLPILVNNLLEWLVPGSSLPPTLSARPGDSVPLLPLAGARQVQVARPDGRVVTLAPPFPLAPFSATDLPGIYTLRQVEANGAVHADAFAVNLFPPSPNGPAGGAIQAGPAARPTAPSPGQADHQTRTPGVPLDVTAAFAGLALAVLCAEWWVASHGR